MALSNAVLNSSQAIFNQNNPVEQPATAPTFVKNYTIIPQVQTKWCWAAVTASVYNCYGGNVNKCDVVNACLGQDTCCTDGGSDDCNKSGDLATSLDYYHVYNPTVIDSPPGTQDILNEIANQRPVCVQIKWNAADDASNFYHVVSIYGISGTTLYIGDPELPGKQVIDYEDFPSNYDNGGYWAATYFTKSF